MNSHPDEATIMSALAALLALADFDNQHLSFRATPAVESALLSLHAKCGMLFEKNHEKYLVSRMVAACAQHGDGSEALALIHRMELEGISLNGVMLSGCSHRAPIPGCSNGGCSMQVAELLAWGGDGE
ncbi:hypothetical protein SELMODRAFT_405267 [Selaginella moellendorffii]|uniref:Pentacotripeptide-repeat region of PRORP domain-containing protein n=1 Tax=Selaginella moellendorffii TaxID=88036 RepID=D8QWT4_SELML|nr:hypothetical protein SELMODRAFT_405267 [Selaginella moellendorffii]